MERTRGSFLVAQGAGLIVTAGLVATMTALFASHDSVDVTETDRQSDAGPESAARAASLFPVPRRATEGGIRLAGGGRFDGVVLRVAGDAAIGSFDGAFRPREAHRLDDGAIVHANGNVRLERGALLRGTLFAEGLVRQSRHATVRGAVRESMLPAGIPLADDLVTERNEAISLDDDNHRLAEIFGASWKPVTPSTRSDGDSRLAGRDGAGDLVIEGGSHVLPSGTYRVRNLHLREGATLVLDATQGPCRLLASGTLLSVRDGSRLLVETTAGDEAAEILLGPRCDVVVASGSVLGKRRGARSASGRYLRILASSAAHGRIEAREGSRIHAGIHAVAHDVRVVEGSAIYGRAVARSLEVRSHGSGSAIFAVDASMSAARVDSTRAPGDNRP